MTASDSQIPTILFDKQVLTALVEDIGAAGDLTSSLTVSDNQEATAEIVLRKPGVIAGLAVAARVFEMVDDSLTIELLSADGDGLEANATTLSVSGNARNILTAERTALNFLGHLSGIATETRMLVNAVAHTDVHICCTRKTTPGLRAMEKYAVRCGGGYNHRFGLHDGVLIKDNHIVAANGVADAVRRAKAKVGHMVKVEVEVDRIDQIGPALDGGADVILLDNMDGPTMTKAVKMIGGQAIVEASGSITLENVAAVAETGVDVISIGWITHSAPSLDLGLDFRE